MQRTHIGRKSKCKNTVTNVGDYRRGFGLDIGFIDHYTYNSERQVITAPPLISTFYKSSQHTPESFPACCVCTSRSLATASNNGDSSASVLKSSLNGGFPPTDCFLHRLPYSYGNSFRGNLFTELFSSSARLFMHIKNLPPSHERRSVICLAALA
jgi:hypothetical protein